MSKRSSASPKTAPSGRTLVCDTESPVTIIFDVTGSMGDFLKIIYDKLGLLFGQIVIQAYLTNPRISFAAVGDLNTDSDPFQICDFAEGDLLGEYLSLLYLEGGGGGRGMESYEMMAKFYLDRCEMPKATIKPLLFFIGDEGFYPTIDRNDVIRYFGADAENVKRSASELDSGKVFEKLCEKFDVYLIHKKYFNSREDKVICAQWAKVLGEERIIVLEDPKAVVDIILGIIAMRSGARTKTQYVDSDLQGKGADPDRIQTEKRRKIVADALKNIKEGAVATVQQDTGVLLPKSNASKSGTGKRL